MTPFQLEIRKVMRGYGRKGGKSYRSLQIRRLEKLAAFAALRGAREAGQVGPKTFVGLQKEFNLSEKTVAAYKRVFQLFLQRRQNKR